MIVQVLQKSVESRIEKNAFKLHCILNSPQQTSVDELDELLTDYVADVHKIKMINEIIQSSTENQETAQVDENA